MKFLIGLVLLLLLPGVTAAFALNVVLLTHVPAITVPLCVGALLGIVVDHFVLRRVPVAQTFEHELTHAVAALMFFRRITGFVVKKKGGTVSYHEGFGGQFGTDFIGLAPYVFPLFAALSVAGRFFVPDTWFPWYDGWIGFTLGYHIWSSIEEIGEAWTKKRFVSAGTGEVTQTDIARRGYIYSAVFIATFTLAIHGIMIALIVKGTAGVLPWAKEVWSVTSMISVQIYAWVKWGVVWAWGKAQAAA
jgi:hypothetical protein